MIDLADTLQISSAAGLILGGLVGLLRASGSADDIAGSLAADCAYGAFLGTLFGMSLWMFEALGGGAR